MKEGEAGVRKWRVEKNVRLKRIVFSAEVRRPSDWAERSTLYVRLPTLLLSCPCRMLGKKAARQLARHARVRQARQRTSHSTPLPCSSLPPPTSRQTDLAALHPLSLLFCLSCL